MPRRFVLVACWAVASNLVAGAELRLTAPLDYQVVQRTSPGQGLVRIAGELSEECPAGAGIEARLRVGDEDPPWQRVGGAVTGTQLTAGLSAPAGGCTPTVRPVNGGIAMAEGLGGLSSKSAASCSVIAPPSCSASRMVTARR